MNTIPWWGWVIIATLSFGALLLALIAACIIAGAVKELRSAESRLKMDDAVHMNRLRQQSKRRHPSAHDPRHVSPKIWNDPDFDWTDKPPF